MYRRFEPGTELERCRRVRTMFNKKAKSKLTVILAILAFVLSATTGVVVYYRIKKSHVQTTSTVPTPPDEGPADWESAFFSALEERTRKVGLPSLRTKPLADGDVELRLWYDARPDIINGIVIGRYRDSWSAFGLRQERNRWPSELKQEDLGVPRSGWNALWKQLTDSGVLVLPDSEKINCSGNALDGVIYVIEVRAEQKYRTYRYDNPQWADCDEAKRILAIEGLIADEFNIRVPDQ